jgi:methylated-DNA-[protein]-cysteine S-methyltransferase
MTMLSDRTQTRTATVDSPIGRLLLVADAEDRLTGLFTEGHRTEAAAVARELPVADSLTGVLAAAATQLAAYFAGERRSFDLPMAPAGSPLQQDVWDALCRIPYGTTTSYGALAASLGLSAGAARAVGTANGRNPLSIVVPCHRVVGASGALTGYAGGLEATRRLLVLEARVAGGLEGADDDACWAAVQQRDHAADGTFTVGVRTTGVYCRPSCAGRPDRENVVYVAGPAAARELGLRACRTCAPDDA